MPLSILSVSYPLAPVGTDAVGGAEHVLTLLDEAIVAAGHRSFVIAAEGSATSGTLIATPAERGPLDEAARTRAQAATARALHQVLRHEPVDLIHMHGVDFDAYLPHDGPPVLATLHLPPHVYSPEVWQLTRPCTWFNAVSRSQHAALPRASVPVLNPIPNGIPLDRLQPLHTREDFALAIGRICPEKGFHLAAEACTRASMRLMLAGVVFRYGAHQHYFDSTLRPLVEQGRIEFAGSVGLKQKHRLMGAARCVLIPSQTPETSSLVAMEALACGTPVVAFRAGALPEIVEHERTGFLVDSVEEMADAIGRVTQIDPVECRRVAEKRFSAQKMTARYLETYERIVNRTRMHTRGPELKLHEITSVHALEDLREEWACLWERSGARSVFQHPDWLIPWCRPFHVNEPWVLALRGPNAQLVGLAPFVIYQRGSERVLTLLGAGVSDDQGIVAHPEYERTVLDGVWNFLAQHSDRFDVFELENIPSESPMLQRPPKGWRTPDWHEQDVRPVVRIPNGATSWEEVVPRSMRKRVRYAEERARREGLNPTFETATPTTFDDLFEGLVRLHRARWAARGQEGVLPEHLADFHRRAARRLLDRGVLRLHALRLGDRLAAAFYGFHSGGRTIFYLPAFELDLERHSPGNVLLAHVIDNAIRQDRARVFDFLRGSEAYKYAWGAVDEPLYAGATRPAAEVTIAHAA